MGDLVSSCRRSVSVTASTPPLLRLALAAALVASSGAHAQPQPPEDSPRGALSSALWPASHPEDREHLCGRRLAAPAGYSDRVNAAVTELRHRVATGLRAETITEREAFERLLRFACLGPGATRQPD